MTDEEKQLRFEAFAREYRPLLLTLATRICASGPVDPEELVTEALEQARGQFDPLMTLGLPEQRAWMATALHNRFLDLYRLRRTRQLM